jgi:hypothetical protein
VIAVLGLRVTIGNAGDMRAPHVAYGVVALIVLGGLAWMSGSDIQLQDSNTDIWQHAAALRALIDNPADPVNPFVQGAGGSRHFQPLWLAWAWVARGFDLSVWQVLVLAGYAAMALLAFGVHLFARTYFAQPWAPLVLLLVLVFGWLLPVQHTGFVSAATLIYAAPYPATYLVGFSLVLWALTIRALADGRVALALPVLMSLMVMVHQLGALIGLIGAACFVLCWPDCKMQARLRVAAALALGVGLSQLWPYHSPLGLIFQPGHSSWQGGPNFFGPVYIAAALVPAVFGLAGLRDRKGRALGLAALIYLAAFSVGFAGVQLAGRFLMPAGFVLQIGLCAYLLQLRGLRIWIAALIWGPCLGLYGLLAASFDLFEQDRATIPPYVATAQLLADQARTTQIAAHGLAAWPVVALGYKVVSVPWPEPMIADLAQRQALTAALFDPTISAVDRIALAQGADVQVLLADRRLLRPATLAVLRAQAVQTQIIGDLYRFDLRASDQPAP